MIDPREARPQRWDDMTRDALEELLAGGLTPDRIGELYARSGSLVRLVARRWGLDCRALRARSLGLSITDPDIAAQFVRVVDGAPLSHLPADLMSGSGARCRWRCPDCAEEWVTSVANRTKRKSGCPACARERGLALARSRVAKSSPLSVARPGLVAEFVTNLSRPDRGLESTPSGSHDRVRWRCRRGHEWETTARQRVRHATQCPTCLAGLWTSRLEFQVAELVQASTGVTVSVGARVRRTDRAADEHIDLLIDSLDLLIDLDPSRWHSSHESVERDTRKLERLAGRQYVRVRPRTLGLLRSGRATVEQQIFLSTDDEHDPWSWSLAVLQVVAAISPSTRIQDLTPLAEDAALARADRRWRALRTDPRRRSLRSEHPLVADQLVEVVGRPGLTAADLTPAGEDRVLWMCPECGHRWEARVANRTLLGTGCPPCSYRRGAARSARPRPGRSFADRHPLLAGYFVDNVTHPGVGPGQLKPNSIDRCSWTCPHCKGPWIATPHALNQRPRGGCRGCSSTRMASSRRQRPSGSGAVQPTIG
ncbi:zinc-ribbon domain-containing protein [Modestobacter lapidis]|nr:zinc-ribbon domain-containing protein [Modestobacter lapidis]